MVARKIDLKSIARIVATSSGIDNHAEVQFEMSALQLFVLLVGEFSEQRVNGHAAGQRLVEPRITTAKSFHGRLHADVFFGPKTGLDLRGQLDSGRGGLRQDCVESQSHQPFQQTRERRGRCVADDNLQRPGQMVDVLSMREVADGLGRLTDESLRFRHPFSQGAEVQ